MDARFTNIDGDWGVKLNCEGAMPPQPGEQVTITKRDGSTKLVTLGEFVSINKYQDRVYRIAEDKPADDGLTPITEPGAFEYGGEAYIVKPTRDGERLYAKKVVEITADRLNENDEIVQIELVYEKGAMRFLREEHRMDAERGKALSIRYGRCIVCSHRLKAAESVERGIGPVCIKRFRSAVPA
jgi:hypothetical protein